MVARKKNSPNKKKKAPVPSAPQAKEEAEAPEEEVEVEVKIEEVDEDEIETEPPADSAPPPPETNPETPQAKEEAPAPPPLPPPPPPIKPRPRLPLMRGKEAYLAARNMPKRHDPELLEEAIAADPDPQWAYCYARDIKGAPMGLLGDVIHDAGIPSWIRRFKRLAK